MTDESFASESPVETELTAQVDRVFEHLRKASILLGEKQVILLSELRRPASCIEDDPDTAIRNAIRRVMDEERRSASDLINTDPGALLQKLADTLEETPHGWRQEVKSSTKPGQSRVPGK
jgi:hypothetical protein